MKPCIDAQGLALRFNEDEAVWRCYEQNRRLRRLRGLQPPLPEEVFDVLDWLKAERERRERRYVGKPVNEAV
jgi:hypothetical protein